MKEEEEQEEEEQEEQEEETVRPTDIFEKWASDKVTVRSSGYRRWGQEAQKGGMAASATRFLEFFLEACLPLNEKKKRCSHEGEVWCGSRDHSLSELAARMCDL